MFSPSIYRLRREKLVSLMAARGCADGIVFIPGNDEAPRNYRDNCFPFRQDSSFLYFFGIALPGLAAGIDLSSGQATVYGDEPTMDDIIWTGPVPSIRELADRAGAEHSEPRRSAGSAVASALSGKRRVHYYPPYREETRSMLAGMLGCGPAGTDSLWSLPLVASTVALREIKGAEEITELEAATATSVAMHRAALTGARVGRTEAEVSALVAERGLALGSGLAFPIIATTRGEVLHNHSHSGRCTCESSFLLDAGAESEEGYSGDLTTTFPMGPCFSPRRRELYQVLMRVFETAVSALGPGRNFRDAHLAASGTLARGLRELGIMKGDPEEAVAAGAHALFFPHGLGHMIGLDVHDMESYGENLVGYGDMERSSQFGLRSLRLGKTLRPGMVHSVEPGIYFIPALIAQWKRERRHEAFIAYEKLDGWLDSGGMRNEEDWLVTGDGARRLGPEFDKSLSAIEAARSEA